MSPICFGVNDILSQAMIKKPRWGYQRVKIDTISGRYYYVQFKYLVLCTSGFF